MVNALRTNTIAMALIAGIVSCVAVPSNAAPPGMPNIVIILVDDMGYGDPGCYNPQSKIPTPNIDSLARAGMRFTDAHAAGSLCHPSRYGLLTGRYPFRTDVTVWPKHALIEAGQTTIASLLKKQGYKTAMVGKWHLGFEEKGYDKPLRGGPVDHGFDSFYGMRASTDIPPYFYIHDDRAVQQPTDHIDAEFSEGWSKIQGLRRLGGGIAPDMKLEEVLPTFTDMALKTIDNHGRSYTEEEHPLMLYLAYTSPHTPWLPSEQFIGKSGAGLYGDFAMNVDVEIGRVLAGLRAAGMEENTLLFLMSDNGPCWFDADVERFGHDSMGPLRGMKGDIWEAGHRMPFIVKWPGQIQPGSVSSQTICFTDILSTLASVAGVPLAEDDGPDSFDFLPVLLGRQPEENPIRLSLVLEAGSCDTKMIRSGDWKLIDHLGSGGFSDPKTIKPEPGGPAGQLYNLANDIGEANNLYLAHPELVERLATELDRIVEQGRSRPSTKGTSPVIEH